MLKHSNILIRNIINANEYSRIMGIFSASIMLSNYKRLLVRVCVYTLLITNKNNIKMLTICALIRIIIEQNIFVKK